jgi:hypothetical protein
MSVARPKWLLRAGRLQAAKSTDWRRSSGTNGFTPDLLRDLQVLYGLHSEHVQGRDSKAAACILRDPS